MKSSAQKRRLAFLDTETTALHPGEIAQLSYIITDGELTVQETRNYFFTVKWISRGARRVNGFSRELLEELSGGQKFEDRAGQIYADLEQAFLVAHNTSFDLSFLTSEFKRSGLDFSPEGFLCTMEFFAPRCGLKRARGGQKLPRLGEVLDYLQIPKGEVQRLAHRFYDESELDFHDSRFDTAAVYCMYSAALEREEVGPDELLGS